MPVASLTDVLELEPRLICTEVRQDIVYCAVADHSVDDEERLEYGDGVGLPETQS